MITFITLSYSYEGITQIRDVLFKILYIKTNFVWHQGFSDLNLQKRQLINFVVVNVMVFLKPGKDMSMEEKKSDSRILLRELRLFSF